jgi:hypothetical protein
LCWREFPVASGIASTAVYSVVQKEVSKRRA